MLSEAAPFVPSARRLWLLCPRHEPLDEIPAPPLCLGPLPTANVTVLGEARIAFLERYPPSLHGVISGILWVHKHIGKIMQTPSESVHCFVPLALAPEAHGLVEILLREIIPEVRPHAQIPGGP